MSALQITWFALIAVLLAGYVILDGYDLGIGFWHLISRSATERKVLRRAIAPYWDANEVWLITAGGALFAAFPMVYATVFSGFYLALLLVVFALIFRAVSIEFVEHASSPRMKRFWEVAFGLGSSLPALLFGVAMGNILRGLPLDAKGNYTGTFFDLLNPYALLIGVTGFALFAMHGALFVQLGPNEGIRMRARKHALWSGIAYAVLIVACAITTYATTPRLFEHFRHSIWPCAALAVTLVWLLQSMHLNRIEHPKPAFLFSCASIALLFATLAAALFPNFVPSRNGTGPSLTLANSSSSPLTLAIMLGVALVGMVVVVGYTIWVRRTFRGETVEY